MNCTQAETHVAKRRHVCTWCGQAINHGDEYHRWRSFDCGDAFTNKMHFECLEALHDEIRVNGDPEYCAYVNERPTSNADEGS